MSDRKPPTVQAERAVLGSMLMSGTSVERAVRIIGEDPQPFIEPAHRTIYAALLRMYQQNRVIDPLTLNEELKAHEQSDQVGGPPYLQQLVEAVDHDGIERNAREVAFDPPRSNATKPRGSETRFPAISTWSKKRIQVTPSRSRQAFMTLTHS